MIIDINKDIISFKKGINEAINNFKICFQSDSNIIINHKNENHINNIDILLKHQNTSNKVYNLGYNLIVDSIDSIRKQICIKPILYLLFIEQILKEINYDILNNYKKIIKDFNHFIIYYNDKSKLKNVRITENDLLSYFNYNNDFYNDVIKISYKINNVEILENKFNLIEKDESYTIKASWYAAQKFYKNVDCIIWYSPLTINDLKELTNFALIRNTKIVLFFNYCNEDVLNYINQTKILGRIIYCKIHGDIFFDRLRDIKYITKSDDLFYDKNFKTLISYRFGKIKDIEYKNGEVRIIGTNKYENFKQHVSYLQNIANIKRLNMVKGNSYIINCEQKDLENIRNIVSFCKSSILYGIFFGITKTLNILNFKYKNQNLINDLYINLLKFYKIDIKYLQSIKNNIKYSYNFSLNDYVNDFVPLQLYIETFKLLYNNIVNIMSILNKK